MKVAWLSQYPIHLLQEKIDCKIRKNIEIEKSIIKSNKYFAGSSKCTFDYISNINAEACLFYLPEAINNVFFNNDYCESEKDIDLLFYGSLEKRKGIEVFIDIIKQLDEFRCLKIGIIGDGSSNYVKYVKSLSYNIKSSINWFGRLAADEVINIFKRTKIYVFPTLLDNTPNSVIEALCYGLPVVTNNVGGISSFITDNVNGFLIENNDVKRYVYLINELLRNENELARIAEEAKRKSKKIYLPKLICKKTENIYNFIIQQDNNLCL